jgi:TolB-like protein/Tfp pilus assembly protein PilF
MKRCPECRRDYTDETLNFCLDDGALLLEGPRATLHDNSSDDAPTKIIDPHTTAPTESYSFPAVSNSGSSEKRSLYWGSAALALLIILGSAFAYRYYLSTGSNQIDSVAVLPFENGTGDPNLDYLSDGLSESLIDNLLQLPQLKVIARNSSFKYRGADLDLQDAAHKLGVRAIVTGKVTRIADNLNVRVEMIDATENRQLWSEQYNRKATDLASIAQEIAQTASAKLRLKLSGLQEEQLAHRETVNPQAYESLLRGRYHFNKGGTENLRKAIEYFEQAVAADPNYALAHAELSLKYYVLAGSSVNDPKVYLPKAESQARTALALDENLAEAHLAISRVLVARWQWQEGEAERRRATELDPNSAAAHDLYAQLLTLLGRHEESLAHARRAKELDPISPFISTNLAFRLYFASRYDDSISELSKVVESEPDYDFAYCLLGYNRSAKGETKEAITAYEKAVRLGDTSTSIQAYLGAAYAADGERDRAQAILKKLQNTTEYVSPAELAVLYAALGDREGAFKALEQAYVEHDLQLQFLKVDPSYNGLRSDPRYNDLLQRVGLSN